MKSVLPLLLLLIATMLAAGCGDDKEGGGDAGGGTAPSSAEGPVESHREDELAEAALLTIDDLPAGWAEVPAGDEGQENPLDQCDEGPAPGRTGAAETGSFAGDAEALREQVEVFEGHQDAVQALDRLPSLAECLAQVINNGELDTTEVAFSDASAGRLLFPEMDGRATQAYRVTAHWEALGESGPVSDGELYLDLVAFFYGRFAALVRASNVDSPFNRFTLETIVATAFEKLRLE